MKLFYTHDIFTDQPIGGISRYFHELSAGLPELGVSPCVVGGFYLNRGLRGIKNVNGIYLAHPSTRFRTLRNQASDVWQKAVIGSGEGALIHRTFYGTQAFPKARSIVTVFDMIHEIFDLPDPALRARKRQSCLEADHLIAISEATKADVMQLYGIPGDRITVTHLASSLSNEGEGQSSRQSDKPYLLYVGQRSKYKNFLKLATAFANSDWLRANFSLICFGGGPFTSKEMEELSRLQVRDQVIQEGGDDEALRQAYLGASAFIYPSLYEGFGLPLLEAMSLGCPVFCSNVSSIPEVAGDGAVYFDGADEESIRIALEKTLADSAGLDALVKRGRKRAACFSWERCCRETLAVYQRLEADSKR